jgi:hypothetical protein
MKKGERIVGMCRNVRFAHINVPTACDEAKVLVLQDCRSSIEPYQKLKMLVSHIFMH